jgi:hypothetical protein
MPKSVTYVLGIICNLYARMGTRIFKHLLIEQSQLVGLVCQECAMDFRISHVHGQMIGR